MTAPVLLTGATGYVGGRLLRRLTRASVPVRCLVRRLREHEPDSAPGASWVEGDVLKPDTLGPALAGVETAYYLIHAMGSAGDFERLDQQAARNFADAARAAGVRRIIYLGGLGDESSDLSAHLRSRHEVGRILQTSGATVIELRASIILGTGSLSFELVRSLVERLPVMVTPRWVRVKAQPILIHDVLAYLLAARTLDVDTSCVVEIGGADICSYGDIMQAYARHRGLKRLLIGVPFLTPRLSSLWLGLVTPIYARVGKKLVRSVRHPTVVTDDRAAQLFPDIRPVGLDEAIRQVLDEETRAVAETHWADAVSSSGLPELTAPRRTGPRYRFGMSQSVPLPPDQAYRPIQHIGGARGYYYATWIWRMRGILDQLVGGVGYRRGRRDPSRIRVGEPLDFWRVEAHEPGRRLLLRAEMRLPGRAWLEFQVEPEDQVGSGVPRSRIHQTAVFDPRGLLGRLYWWSVYPLHAWIFGGMVRRIARIAMLSAGPTKEAQASGPRHAILKGERA